jgi:hypothetical protein
VGFDEALVLNVEPDNSSPDASSIPHFAEVDGN